MNKDLRPEYKGNKNEIGQVRSTYGGEERCIQSFGNIGTKCNSLAQQFISISTTIDAWATCFDSH